MKIKLFTYRFLLFILVIICFFITCTIFVSKPVAISFIQDQGADYSCLTTSYNSKKVQEYCADYCLYGSGTDTDVEHIFAQSWKENSKLVNDYFNMRKSVKWVNNARGNLGFNNVSHNEKTLKKDKDNIIYGWADGNYFEPLDEYKGDIARTLLYLYYNYNLSKKDIEGRFDINTMIKWAKLDEVSKEEKEYAKTIEEEVGYTNLFITKPDIINLFWE